MRAGVDAHIGFANIADFAFDGSGGKVNNNFVTDLVINSLFRRNVNNFILLLFANGLSRKVSGNGIL